MEQGNTWHHFLVFGLFLIFLSVAFAGSVLQKVPELRPNKWRVFVHMAIAILASVTLHEIAHAYVGSLMGMHFQRIVVTHVGMGTLFSDEFFDIGALPQSLVLFAGPFTNFMLGAIFAVLSDTKTASTKAQFIVICDINFALFVLNMVPIFGMDGSKILYLALTALGFPSSYTALAIYSIVLTPVGLWLFHAYNKHIRSKIEQVLES